MTITLQQVADAAERLVQEYPERFNPEDDDGACLNTSLEDPNIHCVAAQILVDLGKGAWLEHPLVKNNNVVRLVVDANEAHGEIDHDALDYLAHLQGAFDNVSQGGSPWRVAWQTFQAELERQR